jgi:hypothetical protein
MELDNCGRAACCCFGEAAFSDIVAAKGKVRSASRRCREEKTGEKKAVTEIGLH